MPILFRDSTKVNGEFKKFIYSIYHVIHWGYEMSDKIEVWLEKDYERKPLKYFLNALSDKIKERYPRYSIAHLLTNISISDLEEILKEKGVKNAKIVEIKVNLLSVTTIGVLVPEGQELDATSI